MSTAHIFYIPVILLVGIFLGYFVGRQMAENEAKERLRRSKRRAAMAERNLSVSPKVEETEVGPDN